MQQQLYSVYPFRNKDADWNLPIQIVYSFIFILALFSLSLGLSWLEERIDDAYYNIRSYLKLLSKRPGPLIFILVEYMSLLFIFLLRLPLIDGPLLMRQLPKLEIKLKKRMRS